MPTLPDGEALPRSLGLGLAFAILPWPGGGKFSEARRRSAARQQSGQRGGEEGGGGAHRFSPVAVQLNDNVNYLTVNNKCYCSLGITRLKRALSAYRLRPMDSSSPPCIIPSGMGLRHMRFLFGLALLACIGGCATPQLQSRDQWLAESQRVYADRNPEQVIRAAEAVLSAADPGDVTFSHTADGFTARRQFFIYAVLASASGANIFEFRATSTPEGTRATLRVDEKGRVSDGTTVDASVSTLATYRLFFNWLDFALGKGDRWVPCAQVETELKIANGNNAVGLCGPGITSGGTQPVPPRPEWTSPSRASPKPPVHSRDLVASGGRR